MANFTLQSIIDKVRRLTGSANDFQLTNAQIIEYINSFYLYDFPAQYRSLKLEDKYTFNTVQGIDTYPFDSDHYSTVQMPCYCAKREIKLFNDQWSFYGVNFNWQTYENFTYGDGTPDAGGPGYSGTLTSTPIIRSVNNNPIVQTLPPYSMTTVPTPGQNFLQSPYVPQFQQAIPGRVQNILITANTASGTLNVTDDGAGNLIGDCTSGTLDYFTGVIAELKFTQNVPGGQPIQCQYNPVQPSIPLSILFFQNQFTLRPVPNQGYTIELVAYRLPSQVLLGTNNPADPVLTGVTELQEWWETLAFGAAKKVYQDRLDPDGAGLMDISLKEAYALNMSRTYAQLGKQSMNTLFRDQLSYNYGSGGWGFGSGGN